MSFVLTSKDYVAYIKAVAKKIAENGEYISKLDAETGDGDHWANMNMGFGKIVENADTLETQPICDVFKKIGMLMMTTIGGSSGVLYGGAYMSAAKGMNGAETLDSAGLCAALEAMVNDMMQRGKSQPGYKTMIDALDPAVLAYKAALEKGEGDAETMDIIKQAAIDGAEATRDMEAVRGRAYYQADKGKGHLDPGAVTMSYQIECLAEYIKTNLL